MPQTKLDRRSFLKGMAGAAACIAMPKFLIRSASGYTNKPSGSIVTLGLNIAQTGPYADEGAEQLRGLELAIEHLNGQGDGGMLNTFSSKALKGNGILGRKVQYVVGDTENKTDEANASARRMIEKDGAVMVTGGSSSETAIANQALCQKAGVIFMAGVTSLNDTTGKDRKANGFRHYYNSHMCGLALASFLGATKAINRRPYYLIADSRWGHTTAEAISKPTQKMGWQLEKEVSTPLGTSDFFKYLAPVKQSGADTLVLVHYGAEMVNSLSNAVKLGFHNRGSKGQNYMTIVPMLTQLMMNGAGASLSGVHSTVNWYWQLQDEGSKAFVRSFGNKYGYPPSESAHNIYCQVLLYADAVERGKSFNPCSVVEALEDFEFDGLGNGKTIYRGADHQCIKSIPVVRGKENPKNIYDMVEIVDTIPTEKLIYHPQLFKGALGLCNSG